jgi:hypothetical protein
MVVPSEQRTTGQVEMQHAAVLSAKKRFVVPPQQIRLRPEANRWWNSDLTSMQRVVRTAVLEVATQSFADFEAQIGRHCDVSQVKQSVEV